MDENYTYPIFLGYTDFILDSFWKNIFEKMARNNFPPNFSYENNNLNYNEKFIEILENPRENIAKVIRFLEKYGKLRSPHIFYPKKNKSDISSEWKKVPKNKKQRLIIDFIVKIKEKMNLSEDEYKNLISVINHGFTYKCLTNDDITYKKNKIINISGIYFNNQTRTFRTKPIKLTNIKNKPVTYPSSEFFNKLNTYVNFTNNKYKLFAKI